MKLKDKINKAIATPSDKNITLVAIYVKNQELLEDVEDVARWRERFGTKVVDEMCVTGIYKGIPILEDPNMEDDFGLAYIKGELI